MVIVAKPEYVYCVPIIIYVTDLYSQHYNNGQAERTQVNSIIDSRGIRLYYL